MKAQMQATVDQHLCHCGSMGTLGYRLTLKDRNMGACLHLCWKETHRWAHRQDKHSLRKAWKFFLVRVDIFRLHLHCRTSPFHKSSRVK